MKFSVIDTKTKKEADPYKIALKEDWAKSLCYCDMEGFALEEDGSLILMDECGRFEYCPEGRFKVVNETITNGDKLRSMTDEELSKFLSIARGKLKPVWCDKCENHEKCSECILDWLKQEEDHDVN